ncbi:MAG: 1,4-dihydroxy-2-naphthoate octaprenyltransferase [Odoribacter sp.]|nr:1,4-dihydroxy-2-naphthoate octaprenyltransferase [Odoribacter sp.]
MNKTKYYITSFRLRTLPLSLSGVFLGTLLAAAQGSFRTLPFWLAVVTTLCLQILSNLANELGDLQKGTDNAMRLGPIRSIQSGALTLKEFKRTILLFIILSACFGSALVYTAFSSLFNRDGLMMLALGAAAIIAAIKYTAGKGAYGYHGFGDLFVFLFFGLLSVTGSWFLMTQKLHFSIFLPATAIGLLSTGVLNLNNMRDIENDKTCHKLTIPVWIGLPKAKIYHFCLITGAFLAMTGYMFIGEFILRHGLFWLTLPLFIIHLKQVSNARGRKLDSQLKVLSLSTLLFALLAGIGFLI